MRPRADPRWRSWTGRRWPRLAQWCSRCSADQRSPAWHNPPLEQNTSSLRASAATFIIFLSLSFQKHATYFKNGGWSCEQRETALWLWHFHTISFTCPKVTWNSATMRPSIAVYVTCDYSLECHKGVLWYSDTACVEELVLQVISAHKSRFDTIKQACLVAVLYLSAVWERHKFNWICSLFAVSHVSNNFISSLSQVSHRNDSELPDSSIHDRQRSII